MELEKRRERKKRRGMERAMGDCAGNRDLAAKIKVRERRVDKATFRGEMAISLPLLFGLR